MVNMSYLVVCSDDMTVVHPGLCDIISGETTSKSLCTRALWCLANQSFSSSQLMDHVTTIITMVSQVLLAQKQATPTVETEALNLFIRSEVK